MDNKYTYGTLCKCLRCGGEWYCRQDGKPVNCAKCNSSYWDKPKVRKPKNGEVAQKVVAEIPVLKPVPKKGIK